MEQEEERKQLLRMLHEGLLILPLKQREALRITILESCGLSIRDAGSAYGIPYSTLRHRSKQGLWHLRRFLQREMRARRQQSVASSQESGDRSQKSESGVGGGRKNIPRLDLMA